MEFPTFDVGGDNPFGDNPFGDGDAKVTTEEKVKIVSGDLKRTETFRSA